MLVQRYPILVLLVELCGLVLVDVLRQGDGAEVVEIIAMGRLEVVAEVFQEGLGVLPIAVGDELDKRVDENRP